jgi:hypothetical protein
MTLAFGSLFDYDNWDKPGMMIILCRAECHPIADALRRRGIRSEANGEKLPLLFD